MHMSAVFHTLHDCCIFNGKDASLSDTVLHHDFQSTLRRPTGHVTCISAAHTCTNVTLSSTLKGLDNSHCMSCI